MFDLSFELVFPALELLDMPLDLPFQRILAQSEDALLPFEFFLEDLEGGEGHFRVYATEAADCNVQSVKRENRGVKLKFRPIRSGPGIP